MTRRTTRGKVVAFGLDGAEIHVRAPDSRVAGEIASLFPDYRKEVPDESACLHRMEVIPVDDLAEDGESGEGYRIRTEGEARTTADRVDMLTLVEGVLARRLLEAASGRVHLHAAGVEVGSGTILALGTRGAGKSSLALAWSLMGLPVLGDDVVFVDESGRARPFRRLFKVDPERLESHGIDPASTPAWAEGSEEAWFDPRTAGGWSEGALPVRAVVVLEGRIGEGPDGGRSGEGGGGSREAGVPRREAAREPWSLTPLEPAVALNDLLASVMSTGRSREASLDPLLTLLDGCEAHRLSFASSAGAARGLAELIEE